MVELETRSKKKEQFLPFFFIPLCAVTFYPADRPACPTRVSRSYFVPCPSSHGVHLRQFARMCMQNFLRHREPCSDTVGGISRAQRSSHTKRYNRLFPEAGLRSHPLFS